MKVRVEVRYRVRFKVDIIVMVSARIRDKFMLWVGLEFMIGSVLGLGLELKVELESSG